MGMRKIFADTSILIAGCGSRTGASRAVLTMAEIGLFKLVVSEQVLEECQRNFKKKLPAAIPIFNQMMAAIDRRTHPYYCCTLVEIRPIRESFFRRRISSESESFLKFAH